MTQRLQTSAQSFDVSAAEDVAVVLRARALRRRLGLLLRVLMSLLVFACVPTCGLIATLGFVPDRCRAKQRAARGDLKALFIAEQSYFAEHDRYNDDLSTIDFWGPRAGYRYVITDIDDDHSHATFRAWAFSIGGDAEDVWSINGNGDVEHEVNGCE
jgi:hypothetical protein